MQSKTIMEPDYILSYIGGCFCPIIIIHECAKLVLVAWRHSLIGVDAAWCEIALNLGRARALAKFGSLGIFHIFGRLHELHQVSSSRLLVFRLILYFSAWLNAQAADYSGWSGASSQCLYIPNAPTTITPMTGPITLFCLIHGTPSHRSFSVKVGTAETVDVLKNLIVLKKPNYFKNIDLGDLNLWKACIPKEELSNFKLNDDQFRLWRQTIQWKHSITMLGREFKG